MSSVDPSGPHFEPEYSDTASGAASGEDEYVASLTPPKKPSRGRGKASSGDSGPTAAQALIAIAQRDYTFGIDQNARCFALPRGGHITRPLKNGKNSFRKEISTVYYQQTGLVAPQNALTEAMTILEHFCEATEPIVTYVRAASPNEGEILLDVGDAAAHVIRITADGWEVLDGDTEVPVIFHRTTLTNPLPIPERGGDLEQIWKFVNVKNVDDRQVARGWLVAAVVLVGLPCPIFGLLGEQGTAKTTAARRLTSLFDPTGAPVRRPPKDIDKLMHSLAGSRTTVLDNLSSIPHWMSDALCRAVTGESDADRMLYTDDELRIIKVMGVIAFTGIDVGALNGDLAERCVWGNLERISPSERRSERELQREWDASYASIVGGLLDLVVLTLQALPQVSLAEKPRMADFAEVLAAIDLATGSDGLSYYMAAQEAVADEIVATDTFIVELTSKIRVPWRGTTKELYPLLTKPEGEKYWPAARGLAGKLKRIAPDLRKAGWAIDQVREDPRTKRAAAWTITPPSFAGKPGTPVDFAQAQAEADGHTAHSIAIGSNQLAWVDTNPAGRPCIMSGGAPDMSLWDPVSGTYNGQPQRSWAAVSARFRG